MSAHSYIRTPGYIFFGCRESYFDSLASLFRDEDLVTSLQAPVYETVVQRMRERMDVVGLTATAARQRLDADYAEALAYNAQAESFDAWLARARWRITGADAPEEREMFEDFEVPYWTFRDPRLPFRLMLDELRDGDRVALDLREVVSRGYEVADGRLCQTASEKEARVSQGPMIVLTEGSSDGEAIAGALEVLAPHLSGLIRFLDWDLKPEGGASALVRGVRALAASGVRNQVLALLDNDTAGIEAEALLSTTPLPMNFKVLRLPCLNSASDYPTLGPTGTAPLDINGSAVSIELFFGPDVLGHDSDRTPIQWTGYSRKSGQYQGEILDKVELQQRFAAKVSRAKANRAAFVEDDWQDMQVLVHAIKSAFSSGA